VDGQLWKTIDELGVTVAPSPSECRQAMLVAWGAIRKARGEEPWTVNYGRRSTN